MVTLQVLVVIDAKPKDLGLPTEAYIAVEEVHDVSPVQYMYYIQCRKIYKVKLKAYYVVSSVEV